jgi:hypothetical protein
VKAARELGAADAAGQAHDPQSAMASSSSPVRDPRSRDAHEIDDGVDVIDEARERELLVLDPERCRMRPELRGAVGAVERGEDVRAREAEGVRRPVGRYDEP